MSMSEDEFKELFRQFLQSQMGSPQMIYCQRCEEPRTAVDFIPGRPHGICLHCLSRMGRGEMVWLKETLKNQGKWFL